MQQAAGSGLDGDRHPFSYPGFLFYWIARLSTTLGQNCMVVVIGWQVYDVARLTMDLKGAALWLGLVGLVQFVPMLLLTLVTGWVADRMDRRLIGRLCIGVQIFCAATLGWFSFAGAISLAPLFAVAGLLGVARAFYGPAQNALGPNLVPREVLPRAIAMNSIAGRIGGILGPAAGGYLYAVAPHVPYSASACLYLVSLLCLMQVGPVAVPKMDPGQRPWRQMLDGFHYIFENRLVLGAISLDLFAVLLGGATALLPIYARDILHVGPAGLGALRAAPAVGALVSATWLAWRPLRENVGPILFLSVAVFGAATIAFGLSRALVPSLCWLTLLGGADMLSVYIRQSLIQIWTPNEKRGRVGAISTLFVSASNELGEAESGFLAALVGPVTAVVIGGAGAIAVAALWALWFPALRTARTFAMPAPRAT